VIESADVIIEVLDARDPLGSRCPQVEEAVLSHGPRKRLVLLLNKIGSSSVTSYCFSKLDSCLWTSDVKRQSFYR